MKRKILTLMLAFMFAFGSFNCVNAQEAPLKGYVHNLTMTSANTEYDWVIPNGVAAITIQCRGAYDVKLGLVNAASGTTYFTIKSGTAYYESRISSYINSIHVQCATASQVLEIIYWM